MIKLQSYFLYFFCSLIALGLLSCFKPEVQDVPPVNIDRKYCNDPFAVNYNDSFPGIPDNSTCVYAYDVYLGAWVLYDSTFKEDSSFYQFKEMEIAFDIAPSEEKNEMNMSGFCEGSLIHLKADKFGRAAALNHLKYPDSAQVICGGDSVMGFFNFKIETRDTLLFHLTEQKTSGLNLYHKGMAIRK